MRRKLPLIAFLLALAGFTYWAWWRNREERELVLSGTIEAREVEVGSLVGGRVAQVHVDEGAAVEPGQLLVSLEPDLVDLQIREQEARVAQARAVLERTEKGPRIEELERARVAAQAATTDRKRFEDLWRQGVGDRRTLDQALVAEKTAQQTFLEAQRGSRPEDIGADQAAYRAALEQLAYLQRQRSELDIRAPSRAVVHTMDLRPGDLLAPNQPALALLESDQLWVRVFVPEPRLGEVHVGEAVSIEVDGYPGRAFPGRIVEIRDRGEYTPRNLQTREQRADLYFGVKVAIDPAPELKAGMTAFVRPRSGGKDGQTR
ncbi:MAG: HlyD family secretion protein [Acidobacteriota bacterium]